MEKAHYAADQHRLRYEECECECEYGYEYEYLKQSQSVIIHLFIYIVLTSKRNVEKDNGIGGGSLIIAVTVSSHYAGKKVKPSLCKISNRAASGV